MEYIDYFARILYLDAKILSYVYIFICLIAQMHMCTHFTTLQTTQNNSYPHSHGGDPET